MLIGEREEQIRQGQQQLQHQKEQLETLKRDFEELVKLAQESGPEQYLSISFIPLIDIDNSPRK